MRIFSNKRGDTGSGASALVLLIALIIVFYILAVDPSVRQDILSDGNGSLGTPNAGGNSNTGNGYSRIGDPSALLDAQPGPLNNPSQDSRTINLDAIVIEEKKTQVNPVKDRSIYVKNSLFSEKSDSLDFDLKYPQTSDLVLSFRVKEMDGRLVVFLNGDSIFEQKVTSVTPNPITLPQSKLKEKNVLEFRVSGPGIKFWDANEYVLEQVSVIGSYVDESQLEGTQSFILLGSNELINTDKANLRYLVICNSQERGKLTITLNGNVLKSYLPECIGTSESIDFTPEKLTSGDNVLSLSAVSGDFIIDQPRIKLDFKEPILKEYLFKLDKSQLAEVRGDRDLELYMDFTTETHKSLTVRVNGEPIEIDEIGRIHSENIDIFAREGNNYITLEPRSPDINMLTLRAKIK